MRLLCVKVLTFAVAAASLGVVGQPARALGQGAEPTKDMAGVEKPSPVFSDAEMHDFMAKAHRAEAISDPLQRCIAYPDPPGSHWSAAAARAYCTYHMLEFMPYKDAKALVEAGKAAELDAYLGDALKKQLTRKESAGLLDHIYYGYFSSTSPETRAMIDAWKRQRPKSAFALAASGQDYMNKAWAARGTRYASDTPRENFKSMGESFKLAREELEKAIAIDPRVLPAYSGLINISRAYGDMAGASEAARRGLAVQAANYSIYGQLLGVAEPRWGGSLDEMSQLIEKAQAHAKDNDLLKLLLPLRAAYEAKITTCDCTDPAIYRTVLDQMPSGDLLVLAANAADAASKADMAVVYQSEVIRFYPKRDMDRSQRMRHLITLGENSWARADADALSTQASADGHVLDAALRVYMTLGDNDAVRRVVVRMDELGRKDP